MKEKVHPCLWFDGQAKAAADYYCSIFPNSRIITDSAIVVNFELNGKYFMALNGGKELKFNEAVSFVIPCKNQEEIDYYWNNFIADGVRIDLTCIGKLYRQYLMN